MNREGDWMCVACQHVNFKKRDGCQRYVWTKHNRMLKFDRIGCGMHNYASRAECYKCKTPMDSGETSELVDCVLKNESMLFRPIKKALAMLLADSSKVSMGSSKSSTPVVSIYLSSLVCSPFRYMHWTYF
ncbi:hypothetical protein EJD97_004932 [Solanum chilense]|uniref:Uncharacterized protein n=1 Tax=Solanum chilense TaxID=4083 RepID=A0A6N2BY62_SOLCI|nr:hypothetical protein EJD97_004932 [Solanum chilense]